MSLPVFVSARNDQQRNHFRIVLDDADITNEVIEAHATQGWVLCLKRSASGGFLVDPEHPDAPARELRTGRVQILPAYEGPYRAVYREVYDLTIGAGVRRLERIQEVIDTDWSRLIPAFEPGRSLWTLDYEPVSQLLGLSLYTRYGHNLVRMASHFGSRSDSWFKDTVDGATEGGATASPVHSS